MKKHLKEFKENIKDWIWKGNKKDDDYQEMVEVHTKDRADLTDVYNELEDEDYKMAFQLAYNLDTVVRDNIPTEIWDLLCEKS